MLKEKAVDLLLLSAYMRERSERERRAHVLTDHRNPCGHHQYEAQVLVPYSKKMEYLLLAWISEPLKFLLVRTRVYWTSHGVTFSFIYISHSLLRTEK